MHHVVPLDDSTPAGCNLSLFVPIPTQTLTYMQAVVAGFHQTEVHFHSFY